MQLSNNLCGCHVFSTCFLELSTPRLLEVGNSHQNQADMRSGASAGGVENIRVRRPPIIMPKAPNVTHQTDDVDVKDEELC